MSMLFLAIPLTLFVLFVLPVWLWLHYNNRGANGSLTGYAGGIDKKIKLLKHEGADMFGLFVPGKGTAL